MSKTIRLTMAQAVVKYLAAQQSHLLNGSEVPLFAGMWAIFGHGNVAAMGEALYHAQNVLPTYRAHNEQSMAHAAIAFAKAQMRRQVMACTSSIGPGALNMVTAAALAHVNRLPVLFLPGDVFANRRPDPVLQQVEDWGDGSVSANDCFRPVSRYFDRITRPEQILTALPRAMQVLTDPAECGPVTLSLCQDVQAEAFDYPEDFFKGRIWNHRRQPADHSALTVAATVLADAKAPVIIAGGGVLYSGASSALQDFAEKHGIPVVETQAGKSSLPDSHPLNLGAVGVTGTSAANEAAANADVVLAIGTRLQDFTTGSWALFKNPARKIISINTQLFDAGKHHAYAMVADAREALGQLQGKVSDYLAPAAWTDTAKASKTAWVARADAALAPTNAALPSDAQVIGAVLRTGSANDIVVCASGGLPGELHKLWRAEKPGHYHLEYGFSCMGYEIAGGLGVKMARPEADVVVMVGDGSYMMLNSELATAVMLGQKLTVVVLDNRGFGCINRLQRATGGESFNNLLQHAKYAVLPNIDFRAHAASMGAKAIKAANLAELEAALTEARSGAETTVIVIDTDPLHTTQEGGHWWDVAVPEVSQRAEVREARARYESALKNQTLGV